MNKFEIGQRVVVARDEHGGTDTELLGETGVVETVFRIGTVNPSYSVLIDPEFELSHGFGGLHFEEIELEAL